MSKIVVEYFPSEEIPDMLFDTEYDAANFDLVLIGYCNNKKAIEEFKKAENQYASDYAVQYNIDNGTFVHNLNGPYSDSLICAAEQMVSSCGELANDDCYTETFSYIRNKLYGKH